MAITGLHLSRDPGGDINEGDILTLTTIWGNQDNLLHTLVIEWGDGTSSTYLVPSAPAYIISRAHTYTTSGVFEVLVRVSAGSSHVIAGMSVAVINIPPAITSVIGNLDNSTRVVVVDFTFTCAGVGNNFYATLEWGDGTSTQYWYGAPGSYSVSHTYQTIARRQITLIIVDTDGGTIHQHFYPLATYYENVDDTSTSIMGFNGVIMYHDSIDTPAQAIINFNCIPFYHMSSYSIGQSNIVASGVADYVSVLILPKDLECAKVGNIPFEQLILPN